MAEFLLGSTLFREGGAFKSNLDQFKFITDTIGFDLDADAIHRFNPQERVCYFVIILSTRYYPFTPYLFLSFFSFEPFCESYP